MLDGHHVDRSKPIDLRAQRRDTSSALSVRSLAAAAAAVASTAAWASRLLLAATAALLRRWPRRLRRQVRAGVWHGRARAFEFLDLDHHFVERRLHRIDAVAAKCDRSLSAVAREGRIRTPSRGSPRTRRAPRGWPTRVRPRRSAASTRHRRPQRRHCEFDEPENVGGELLFACGEHPAARGDPLPGGFQLANQRLRRRLASHFAARSSSRRPASAEARSTRPACDARASAARRLNALGSRASKRRLGFREALVSHALFLFERQDGGACLLLAKLQRRTFLFGLVAFARADRPSA